MIRSLGRYRIVDELGRGAMSIVYRGYDPSIHRMLAIKTLREEYAGQEEYRQRFLTEARAAGTLTHPGIVTVFDVGESEGVPFIAMELLEGVGLGHFLATRPGPSLRTVLRIAIQIADALDYAHRNGVVHRDIKPENIVCTGEAGDVKVTDFGIAQMGTEPVWRSEAGGRVAGTPQYMAPELLRGQNVDGRADLYSLGVVMYLMLSGRLPFSAHSLPELLRKAVGEPPPPLSPRHPDTPEPLLDAIATLLAKEPERRYQNATELIEDLQQIDDQLAEQERAWSGRRIVPIRIRWTAFMSALVALTVTAGLLVVYQIQQRATRDLAFDYGFTLARQLALQSAEDLLLEDSIAVQTLVEAMAENREIADIEIRDRGGRLLASSRATRVASADFPGLPSARLLRQRGEQRAFLSEDADGDGQLLFDTPIEYDGRAIGRLRLGLSTEPLVAAGRATVMAMVALTAVTLLAVLVGAYFLSRRLMGPIETLRRALWKIAQGRLDSRIRMQRRDEFERVFSAYNAMAESLQARLHPGATRHGDEVADGAERGADWPRPDTQELPLDDGTIAGNDDERRAN